MRTIEVSVERAADVYCICIPLVSGTKITAAIFQNGWCNNVFILNSQKRWNNCAKSGLIGFRHKVTGVSLNMVVVIKNVGLMLHDSTSSGARLWSPVWKSCALLIQLPPRPSWFQEFLHLNNTWMCHVYYSSKMSPNVNRSPLVIFCCCYKQSCTLQEDSLWKTWWQCHISLVSCIILPSSFSAKLTLLLSFHCCLFLKNVVTYKHHF